MSVAGFSFETATRRGRLWIECVLHVCAIRLLIAERFERSVDAREGSMRSEGMSVVLVLVLVLSLLWVWVLVVESDDMIDWLDSDCKEREDWGGNDSLVAD